LFATPTTLLRRSAIRKDLAAMADDESDDSSTSSSSSEEGEGQGQQPKKKQRTTAVPPPLEIAPTADAASSAIKNQTNANSLLTGSKSKSNRLIILLDQAKLETVKNRRGNYELLNCDDHRDLCKKKLKKDPKEFRPDICHQELLALLDSPLNKSGHLQIYIRTSRNVLIELHPSVRIPRTYKRFAGLMVQLLHKMKIKASENGTTLMKVIKNPFSQHLPVGTHVYGMSCQGLLYSPMGLTKALIPLNPDEAENQVCFVIGAMAAGHVTVEDHPYIEKMFSISEYPLSGAAAINRILGAIEHRWGIV
jgi:rRNA small subunit pseudouridine methyltransferase Nep1